MKSTTKIASSGTRKSENQCFMNHSAHTKIADISCSLSGYDTRLALNSIGRNATFCCKVSEAKNIVMNV
jgi:hypothetical protein